MQEPFETPAFETPAFETPACVPPASSPPDASTWPDEIIATPEATHALTDAAPMQEGQAPLREIATAFRMNAEALHTLKQMQAELSESVRRGDRSQLVLQSTRALNDTFRNLSAVQRELLSRLDGSRPAPASAAGGRGPLIPMLILGLLAVLLGGIYVVLDAIENKGASGNAQAGQSMSPDHAQRVIDSFTKGRSEGAAHADAELRRLSEQLDEEKGRGRRLEQDLSSRETELGSLERQKRTAELERDGLVGQIRQAQADIMTRKALEEELVRLQGQAGGAKRILERVEQDYELERRANAFLRQRLAEYGMGYSENDPPWRPGVPAGAEDPSAPGRITKLPTSLKEKQDKLDLLILGRKKMGMSTKDLERQRAALGRGEPGSGNPDGPWPGSASAPVTAPKKVGFARSAVPPPAAVSAAEMAGRREGEAATTAAPVAAPVAAPTTAPTTAPAATRPTEARPPVSVPPASVSPERGTPRRAPSAAAYGGDGPGALPPPAVLRKRGTPQRRPSAAANVRVDLNRLLSAGGGRAGWQISRIAGVAGGRLDGVVLTRYDAAGRPVERVEAGDMRISVDRRRRSVAFDVRAGVGVGGAGRTALPAAGRRIIVAQGAAAERWSASTLTLIRKE